METPNFNQKLFFSEDTSEIISEILKKYHLEETEEELDKIAEKLFGDNPVDVTLRGEAILKTAVSLIKKEITEKEAVVVLQKIMNTPQTTAEGLIDEIKTRLTPITIPEKPIAKEIKNIPSQNDNNNSTTSQIEKPIDSTPPLKKRDPKTFSAKKIITQEQAESVGQQNKIPKGQDTYREPIE